MSRTMLVTIAVIGAMIGGVSSAIAGQGETDTTAWVTVSPGTVAAGGARVDLRGCGYDIKPVQLRVTHSAGYTEVFGTGMWNTGCFSTYFTTAEAGTYTISVYESQRSKRQPWVLAASTELTVV